MEESQRQNLVTAFNNVLRTSTLVGVVDLQRAAMGFSALVDQVPEGTPVPLGPIYDFLLEQKAPEPAVREVIVFFKSRESRFGVPMELPPQLATLPPAEVEKLIVAFTARGASSGTYAGKPVEQSGAVSKGKTPSGTTNLNAVNTPAAGSPAAPKKKSGPAMPTQTKLGIVLAVLALVLVINLIVNAITAEPPPQPLTLSDPAGLPCVEPKMANRVVMCRVPQAYYEKTPRAVIDAKVAVTFAAIKAQGMAQLMVFTIEDGKMRQIVP